MLLPLVRYRPVGRVESNRNQSFSSFFSSKLKCYRNDGNTSRDSAKVKKRLLGDEGEANNLKWQKSFKSPQKWLQDNRDDSPTAIVSNSKRLSMNETTTTTSYEDLLRGEMMALMSHFITIFNNFSLLHSNSMRVLLFLLSPVFHGVLHSSLNYRHFILKYSSWRFFHRKLIHISHRAEFAA